MPNSHVQDHVELIAKHEQEFLIRRTRSERITDAIAGFIGTPAFVLVHVAIFAVWIVWNSAHGARHWDPEPFALLQTCAAMEALLVASFILMKQTRLGKRSDERDHLMLQILILSEKEITALLSVNREIATEVGIDRVANEADLEQFSEPMKIDEVTQTLKETLPE